MLPPEKKTDETVVRGEVERVTYRNPDNGYTVLQLRIAEQRQVVTVVGICLDAREGSHVLVRGSYTNHPKFGRQFAASSITSTTPSSTDGLTRYLASGLIKGVGEVTASRLVEKFGEKTLEIICQEPARVATVKGIGKRRAEELQKTLSAQHEMQEVMRFLVEHKLSPNLASRIIERYKNRAVEILGKDPYVLARDMRGVGFLTADTIAKNLGLADDSPQRLKAGLYYALERAADDGHTYLRESQLITRAGALLGLNGDYDLSQPLQELIDEEMLVREEDAVFPWHLARAERFVARFIASRAEPRPEPLLSAAQVSQSLKRAALELRLHFSAQQEQAVHAAATHRLLIITGGPGCGKTTIIRALTTLFRYAGKSILLAAPTGRAAQRMAQVTGLPASTIHRMLRFDPLTGRFIHGPTDPLIGDCVIIDETSMLDIQLARDLFSAIPRNATLILVGDKDQLPSVGPGRVFADLVKVRHLKTVALSQLFRRSEESAINIVAHTINCGSMPEIPSPGEGPRTEAYFLARSDGEEAGQLIERLVADQIPKKFGFEPDEIAVLTPSNRGPLGTQALNVRLQHALNTTLSLTPDDGLTVGDTVYRVGDRVCQRVNNYQLDDIGVFNGDIGRIYSIDMRSGSMIVEMWDGRLIKYDSGAVHQLSLAYAITVHRSQGSEFPCVVLALHDSHFALLERQLIYTAVTRAKQLLLIVGSRRALSIAVRRTSGSKRQTLLFDRIEAALENPSVLEIEGE